MNSVCSDALTEDGVKDLSDSTDDKNTSLIDNENKTTILSDDTSNGKDKSSLTRKRERKLRYQPKNVKLEANDKDYEYYVKLAQGASSSTDINKLEIPRAIVVQEHMLACRNEISAMMTAISQNASAKTMLQRLPRHMRRRAASHNIKRLPRRFHDLANQLNANKSILNKTENRKKRRRKVALRNKHASKSNKPQWLETHLWHAKRFHLTKCDDERYKFWDKYVPLYANDKSFRASYRAVNQHCLIQDISYMKCYKVTGRPIDLYNFICEISCFDVPNNVQNGDSEEDIMVVNKQNKTISCIGPANVIWNNINEKESFFWIWFHPLMKNEITDLFQNLLSFKYKLLNFVDKSDDFNRFSLTGPKSYATALSVIRPFVTEIKNPETKLQKYVKENRVLINNQHMLFSNSMSNFHKANYDAKYIRTNESDHRSLFSLVINDPRLSLPCKRTKPTLEIYKNIMKENINETKNCHSALWDDEILQNVAESRLSDHIVSTRKHLRKLQGELVYDGDISDQTISTAIPVLVIKNNGFEGTKVKLNSSQTNNQKHNVHSGPCKHFGQGLNIILPKNWATAFWVPFVYHLARAGGLRENKNIKLQCLQPHFPQDFPDTNSGHIWWNGEAKENSEIYYKKPPAKRPNYTVLASPCPFKPNWSLLFSLTQNNSKCIEIKKTSNTSVLLISKNAGYQNKVKDNNEIKTCQKRNFESVKNEHESVNEPLQKRTKSNSVETIKDEKIKYNNEDELKMAEIKNIEKDITTQENESLVNLPTVIRNKKILRQISSDLKKILLKNEINDLKKNLSTNSLISVRLLMLSKGTPNPCAMICLPTNDDLTQINICFTDPYKLGLQSLHGPIEKKHWDPFRKEKKELKKQKIKSKRPEILDFNEVPSRTLMGFVTSGDFLFSYACGGGIGFVSLKSLNEAVVNQSLHSGIKEVYENPKFKDALTKGGTFPTPIFVLIKNVDSSQYRFAKLELVK